ncbi:hypothetical protein DPX16_21608 [Anabarilius grahami]|uniref:Uncharacterized protein n=1 Tax=Anabarilius grahami TaxID=495550 RepID=A0A3N0XFT0_ANAGA|nr:hypothetical protein DPX16_21608 [Anabarilius grahami]
MNRVLVSREIKIDASASQKISFIELHTKKSERNTGQQESDDTGTSMGRGGMVVIVLKVQENDDHAEVRRDKFTTITRCKYYFVGKRHMRRLMFLPVGAHNVALMATFNPGEKIDSRLHAEGQSLSTQM